MRKLLTFTLSFLFPSVPMKYFGIPGVVYRGHFFVSTEQINVRRFTQNPAMLAELNRVFSDSDYSSELAEIADLDEGPRLNVEDEYFVSAKHRSPASDLVFLTENGEILPPSTVQIGYERGYLLLTRLYSWLPIIAIILVLSAFISGCAGTVDYDGNIKGGIRIPADIRRHVEPLRSSSLHSSRVRVALNAADARVQRVS